MKGEIWVLEYSASQDCFHAQPIKKSISNNLERALRKEPNDWVTLCVGECESVRDFMEEVREGQAQILGRG